VCSSDLEFSGLFVYFRDNYKELLYSDTKFVRRLLRSHEATDLRLYSETSAGVGCFFLICGYPAINSPIAICSSLVLVFRAFFFSSSSLCFFFDILGRCTSLISAA
jgi:hypothetical protein